MSDLISRNKVINLLYQVFENHSMATDKNDRLGGFGAEVFKSVKAMATAYDVDKVVEELERAKYEISLSGDDLEYYQSGLDEAIEIVKQGCVTDDCCEWKSNYGFVSDKYKRETSCGYTFYDLHHAVPFKYCSYCGKKIKVVE